MLTRIAALALTLTGCGGAAGNDKRPPAGGTAAPAARTDETAAAASTTPLTGLWTQTNAPCATGTPAPAKVEELEFEPGGRALVTFGAFETYHDYWGPYRYDPATGALRITVERGNAIPNDVDLDGRATIAANGELVLEGISFGTPSGAGREAPNCTLRFTRRR